MSQDLNCPNCGRTGAYLMDAWATSYACRWCDARIPQPGWMLAWSKLTPRA